MSHDSLSVSLGRLSNVLKLDFLGAFIVKVEGSSEHHLEGFRGTADWSELISN